MSAPPPQEEAPDSALISAVRGALAAEPELGIKKLVAKVKAQHPELTQADGRKVGAKEVRAAMQNLKQQARAEAVAAAAASQPSAVAAAQAERIGVGGGLLFEGHPTGIKFNGIYVRVEGEHEGWPRYQKDDKVFPPEHLYRYLGTNEVGLETWRMGTTFAPADETCGSYIKSVGGSIPTGENTWMCTLKGKWREHKLTVREMVRCCCGCGRCGRRCCCLWP